VCSGSAGSADIFERVGTLGALFLTIEPDPRGEALGGAYSALTKGASGVHWNPAGLAFSGGIEFADQGIIAGKIDWPGDLQLSFESASVSFGDLIGDLPRGTICVWHVFLDMEPMPETTEYRQEGTGYYFDAWDEAVGISYAHRLTEFIGVGITYKRIHSVLADFTGYGNGLDLGGAFHRTEDLTGGIQIEIGAAAGLRNLGSFGFDGGGSTDLPRQGYVGLAPTVRAVRLWDWLVELTLAGELVYDDPMDRWRRMGGIEFVLLDGFAGRYGRHEAEDSERDDSWGLGIQVRYGDLAGLTFEYSKTDLGILGDVERFMLTVRFIGCVDGLDLEALMGTL
jgi:hypothetical protein